MGMSDAVYHNGTFLPGLVILFLYKCFRLFYRFIKGLRSRVSEVYHPHTGIQYFPGLDPFQILFQKQIPCLKGNLIVKPGHSFLIESRVKMEEIGPGPVV